MNPQTLLTIILVFFSVALFTGLLLIVFLIGRNSVKDNLGKALIFITTGQRLHKPIKGKVLETEKEGSLIQYGKNIVALPRQYKEIFYKGRMIVFVTKIGQVIASPFDDDKALTPSQKERLLYEVIESHLTALAVKAIKGRVSKSGAFIIALIAFFVGVLFALGGNAINDNIQKQKQAQIEAQQQEKPTESEPDNFKIEVK